MINVRLAGGLGNQIFQLACALRHANYDIEKIRLYVDDLSKYKMARKFELSKLFDLQPDFCNAYTSILLKTRLARFQQLYPCFVNDKNFMTKNPLIVEENKLASDILAFMNKTKITNICVFRKGDRKKTIGVIHIHNLLNILN